VRSLCPLLAERDNLIPLGLSRRPFSRENAKDFFLVLPLVPWFGRQYLIMNDNFARGWWLARFMLKVRVTRHMPGFELHFRWGSTPLRVTYEPPVYLRGSK